MGILTKGHVRGSGKTTISEREVWVKYAGAIVISDDKHRDYTLDLTDTEKCLVMKSWLAIFDAKLKPKA